VNFIIAKRLEPRSGPTYVGPDLGSSLFASSTILYLKKWPKIDIFQQDADDFFKGAILYPSMQWVNAVNMIAIMAIGH